MPLVLVQRGEKGEKKILSRSISLESKDCIKDYHNEGY